MLFFEGELLIWFLYPSVNQWPVIVTRGMWPVKETSLHSGSEPYYRLAPRACKFSLLSTKRQMPFCAKKFQFRVNQLCNAENANAFRAMEALLQDLDNALHEIQIVKTVTDANNFHAKILTQYKEMIKKRSQGLRKSPSEIRKFWSSGYTVLKKRS